MAPSSFPICAWGKVGRGVSAGARLGRPGLEGRRGERESQRCGWPDERPELTSPKAMLGFAATTLERSALQKIMYAPGCLGTDLLPFPVGGGFVVAAVAACWPRPSFKRCSSAAKSRPVGLKLVFCLMSGESNIRDLVWLARSLPCQTPAPSPVTKWKRTRDFGPSEKEL
eukprot:scaffold87938_cov66-Phaeocystis_antarctica.AAC.1